MVESELEEACLSWFAGLGYEVLDAENLDPDSVYQERDSYEEVILQGRMRAALEVINAELPVEAIDEAMRRVRRLDAPTLIQNNFAFQSLLTDGVTVELASSEGGVRGHTVRLFDFETIEANDFVVGQQLRVVDPAGGTGKVRRPDVVVWVNGLPLGVIELKNPGDPGADVWGAFNQLQTYKRDIPSLFATNGVLVISDDVLSRIGSLTADRSRFLPWRAVNGERDLRVPAESEDRLDRGERLQALVEGVFEKERFLDLLRSFVTFEKHGGKLIKKIAAEHQFYAVRHAVAETVRATGQEGDKRVGVVWHTQGSGKSLTMVFYAGKLVASPALSNPTLVVLTDRNDLDDQLFATFSHAEGLLRQKPVQAEDREHLRALLRTASGGIYFTTMQKFAPPDGERITAPLSDRRNIVVIADEAHRSQYGLQARINQKGESRYGLALHLRDALPNASMVGFTGTPVALDDKNTVDVFGNYISVYDIRRAVQDGATVPIYYESRLAKLELDEDKRPHLNDDFEELTEDEEDSVKEGLKSEWATVAALVGADSRLERVAADLVEHFEDRLSVMDGGKAMVVCMSRAICADLYEKIVTLRPDWHDDADDAGQIKVVMTGSASDAPALQPHVRSKSGRELLASRFKDAKDPLKLVLVRDMWLTGFDAPCMHTLYVDKPMQGHNLMQAIARVNRVYGDKPGGLIVDYLGVASFLKEAMATYTQSGGEGDATTRTERAFEVLEEKLSLCREALHGYDYQGFATGTPAERLDLLAGARQHVLAQRVAPPEGEGDAKKKAKDGYERFMQSVTELSKAAALSASYPDFEEVRDEVAFFQAVKAGLVKLSPGKRLAASDLGAGVRQIVESAVISGQVLDVFEAAGLEKPDVSILSDEFLAEVAGMDHKDLAAAALERLLRDTIRARSKQNVVQARNFEDMLDSALKRYLTRSIQAAELINRLIELAKEMRDAPNKAKALGLTAEESAFYDALAENESAVEVLKDEGLAAIAHELTRIVRKNASIDWARKENVKAQLRLLIKKLLARHGYPPDMQKAAIDTVLKQAERLGINLTEGLPEVDDVEAPAPDSAPEKTTAPAEWPYPIAVFDALLRSQDEVTLRVKTRLDAIERALTLAAICQLAYLRSLGGAGWDAAQALVDQTGGKRVSFGTWLELCLRLGRLLPEPDTHPIARAGRRFVTAGGKPSDLTKRLEVEVVPLRNGNTHGVVVSGEQLADHELPLKLLWEQLKGALSPLRDLRLVARTKLVEFNADGHAHYNVALLSGPHDLFEIQPAVVHGKLDQDWASMLGQEGAAALSLAPMLGIRTSPQTKRRELLFPRTLVLTPGAKVELMPLLGSDTVKIDVK